MQPYIERAIAFLELPEAGWDIDHWEQIERRARPRVSIRPSSSTGSCSSSRCGWGRCCARSSSRRRTSTSTSTRMRSRSRPRASASHVTGVRVQTLAGNQLTVVGRLVVLAVGGIENPRLLLLSDRVQTEGLGNAHDLVGRYFMEHAAVSRWHHPAQQPRRRHRLLSEGMVRRSPVCHHFELDAHTRGARVRTDRPGHLRYRSGLRFCVSVRWRSVAAGLQERTDQPASCRMTSWSISATFWAI